VERAAEAVLLEAAEGEVGAPVRAVAGDESPPARGIAEQHERLAEQAHGLDGAAFHARIEARVELVDECRRLPVAAQQRAAGRARADAGDAVVLLGVHLDVARRANVH
jgi:hypothetical protein